MWQLQSIPTAVIWLPRTANPDPEETAFSLASAPVAFWVFVIVDAPALTPEATGAMAGPPTAFVEEPIVYQTGNESAGAIAGEPVAFNDVIFVENTSQADAAGAMAGTPSAFWDNLIVAQTAPNESAAALAGTPTTFHVDGEV